MLPANSGESVHEYIQVNRSWHCRLRCERRQEEYTFILKVHFIIRRYIDHSKLKRSFLSNRELHMNADHPITSHLVFRDR